MAGLSIWHVLIFAIVVILLFGTSKLKNLGKDVGGAVKDFKKSIKEEEATTASLTETRTLEHQTSNTDVNSTCLGSLRSWYWDQINFLKLRVLLPNGIANLNVQLVVSKMTSTVNYVFLNLENKCNKRCKKFKNLNKKCRLKCKSYNNKKLL
ncbi:unnamed protein product [Oppiella nova]|uniref:Sec-independent protein translocase protein TatA n=1 Tax=Oppiella nova TaxID=334625 RepID=A0A7R9L6V6_9ACAR|nr:unnamed protein product [Oppiella nova]CAG2155724.1 unnamed protein product [Oppiella nova]